MRKKIALAILVVTILLSMVATVSRTNNTVQLQQLDVKTKQQEIDIKNKRLEEIQLKLEDKSSDHEKLEQENIKLQDEIKALQAKKEEERRIANQNKKNLVYAAENESASVSKPVAGNKESWLRASGIPESEWWAVDSIVSRESGWNPNAVNSSSGACGLGQQLPCGKWAGAWNDPVAALKAQYGYVKARYGGYPQAVAFWNSNHWY